MTQLPPPSLDFAAAVTAAFAFIFGPAMAAYVGPYTVIIIGAVVGATWSLGRRPVTTKPEAIRYFLLIVFTALICTVPISEWVGAYMGIEDTRRIFAIVAMLIGGIGGDWPKIVQFFGRRAFRLIERRIGVDEGGK